MTADNGEPGASQLYPSESVRPLQDREQLRRNSRQPGDESHLLGHSHCLLPRGAQVHHPQRGAQGRLSDPDSIRSVDPDPYSESGSRRAKITHKSRKKTRNFNVLKWWMYFF
jgi:hypothetical protein